MSCAFLLARSFFFSNSSIAFWMSALASTDAYIGLQYNFRLSESHRAWTVRRENRLVAPICLVCLVSLAQSTNKTSQIDQMNQTDHDRNRTRNDRPIF